MATSSKNVETQEDYEVSWDDEGNRRHGKATTPDEAQALATHYAQDHELADVQIHKVTTTVERIEFKATKPESVEAQSE